jgi:hypothetical protein
VIKKFISGWALFSTVIVLWAFFNFLKSSTGLQLMKWEYVLRDLEQLVKILNLKFTLEAMKAQRGSKGVALLSL